MRKGEPTSFLKEKSILQGRNKSRFIGKVISGASVTNIGSEIIPVIIKSTSFWGVYFFFFLNIDNLYTSLQFWCVDSCHNVINHHPPLQRRLLTLCFSSIQLSRSVLFNFATPWITACQASLSLTNSWSSPKLMCIESVMPSSHLILCRPLLLLPPIPPSIKVFSN